MVRGGERVAKGGVDKGEGSILRLATKIFYFDRILKKNVVLTASVVVGTVFLHRFISLLLSSYVTSFFTNVTLVWDRHDKLTIIITAGFGHFEFRRRKSS